MTGGEKRCKGICRHTGEPCKRRAELGSDYCWYHGAQALGNMGGKGVPKGTPKPLGAGGPPPRGNTHAMTHGAYTQKLPAAQVSFFEEILAEYMGDVPNPSATDRRGLVRLAMYEAKLLFVLGTEEPPIAALDVLHRHLHRELKALNVTRETKETSSTGTSPAEVIAAIMVKVAERRKQVAEGIQLEAPSPAPQMSSPTRQAAVIDVDPGPETQDIDDDDGTLRGEALQQQLDQWDEEDAAAIAAESDPDPELLEDDDQAEASAATTDQARDGDDDGWPW